MIRPMMNLVRYDVADDFGVPEQIQARWERAAEQAKREIRKAGAPRVDLERVKVDDFDGREVNSRRTSDY